MEAVQRRDRATWAHVARETAGAFVAWSQRVETTPGPLAATSRELARSAHLRAHQSQPKPVRLGSTANAAMTLMQAAATAGGHGTMAEAIMLRKLGRVSVAILDMHTAAGDARRAEQVATMMRNQFAQVAERLPTIPAKEPQAGTDAGNRESRDARLRATDGMAAPGTRSPIPNTLHPTTRKTPASPRERDGHGRE